MTHYLRPTQKLQQHLQSMPLIAILRGIQSSEVLDIAQAIYQQGWRCIEVPLNSPNALDSIQLLAQKMPADCLIGAGTVLQLGQIKEVAECGGKLIVMPHCDPLQIETARNYGLFSLPGVSTISEAFTALRAGADALKLFPAESVPPGALHAWTSVLPDETLCMPVGGIRTDDMPAYWLAGARGFGIGSQLFRPGDTRQSVTERARQYANSMQHLKQLQT